MRIENKTVDASVTLGHMLVGSVYRSDKTDRLYIAGFDSKSDATITDLASGQVWYGTLPPDTKFTPVEAHLVVTKG